MSIVCSYFGEPVAEPEPVELSAGLVESAPFGSAAVPVDGASLCVGCDDVEDGVVVVDEPLGSPRMRSPIWQ
ncbi:MAG TPA: hypothetical protein VFR86_01745, partial [Burkholderiaceae bacterium]|nr:hypothetical protein [Burkholderiaceae bacterium]